MNPWSTAADAQAGLFEVVVTCSLWQSSPVSAKGLVVILTALAAVDAIVGCERCHISQDDLPIHCSLQLCDGIIVQCRSKTLTTFLKLYLRSHYRSNIGRFLNRGRSPVRIAPIQPCKKAFHVGACKGDLKHDARPS
jgi:hypothetical protein